MVSRVAVASVFACFLVLVLGPAAPAQAVEGVILINNTGSSDKSVGEN
jgi:hypothetical protein